MFCPTEQMASGRRQDNRMLHEVAAESKRSLMGVLEAANEN
jgi:hypothetical protein